MIKVNNIVIPVGQFPNKEAFIKIDDIDLNRYKHIIDFKYETDADFIQLMFIIRYIQKNFTNNIHLNIAYYPYSRMDRENDSMLYTLETINEFVNSLQVRSITINDPHSSVCYKDLKYERLNINYLANDLLKDLIDSNLLKENFYILYPDKGAIDRYEKVNNNILTGRKVRDFKTGEITSLEIDGNFIKNNDVVIIDDLCSYGGTALRSAKILKDKGARDIYLVISHCEQTIFDGKIPESDLIKKVYTTNSIINKEQETETINIKELF